MITLSNIKEFVVASPGLCCVVMTSTVTIFSIYCGSNQDAFFTFSGVIAGSIGGSLIEIFDYVYDLGLKRGVEEVFESKTLILNAITTGVTTGSLLGLVAGKMFDVLPSNTLNGLILVDGSLAGMLIGHSLDLYLRTKKTDETSLVTINTLAGAGAGLAISTVLIMELFNKPMNILTESLNSVVNEALIFTKSTVTTCYSEMMKFAAEGLMGANERENSI